MTRIRRSLPSLGIRTKLLGSFILVAAFTGVLGLNAVATVDRMNVSRDEQYGKVFGGTSLLVDWLNQARLSEGDLGEYMLETDAVTRTDLRAEMTATDAQLVELAATFDGSPADGSEAENSPTLSRAWQRYAAWRDQSIVAPLEAGQFLEARSAFEREGDARALEVDQAVVALNVSKNAAAAAIEIAADAQSELELQVSVGLTTGAMLLALLIGYFLSRQIARTAGQVATAAQGLAVGDLDQQVTVHSSDELGQMADAVRSMISYQHAMADVARAMAMGDLTQDVTPKGATDVLGIAFGQMTANLRTFVSDLQQQAATLSAQAQLLDLASDAIIVIDPESRAIQFWSHGAEEIYGFTRAEALGQTPDALLATQFPESKSALLAELFRSDRWEGELVQTRHDGAQLVVASRQVVQRDHAGAAARVMQINSNITDRKRADGEQTELRRSSNRNGPRSRRSSPA